MLEINFLQQDNESFVNAPVLLNLTQLKTGNFVLSNLGDYYRLKTVLSNWQKTLSTIQNLEEKYNMFLETNKNIHKDKIENSSFWKDFPSESISNFALDTFVVESKTEEDFSMVLDIKDKEKSFFDEKNYKKIKKINYPYGNRVFIGCGNGYLLEYSMNEMKIVHDFGHILSSKICSMATTFDNKSLFVCGWKGDFREFDLSTRKQVNCFGIKVAYKCVVTYDNQFLIIAENESNCNLTKWSIQTKQPLHVWKSNVDKKVAS